jgi:hypothetical protein
MTILHIQAPRNLDEARFLPLLRHLNRLRLPVLGKHEGSFPERPEYYQKFGLFEAFEGHGSSSRHDRLRLTLDVRALQPLGLTVAAPTGNRQS